jgi:hypothetical protein
LGEAPNGDICCVAQWLNEPIVLVMADGMESGTGSHAPQSAAALRSSAWLLEHISAQAPLLSLGDERSKQLFQKLVDNYHRARQLIAESLGVSDERGFAAHVPLAIDPTPQGLAMSARRASRWIGIAL